MTIVIGIDCSAVRGRTGLALTRGVEGRLEILETTLDSHAQSPVDVVSKWLLNTSSAILAFDAPLGWPTSLGDELSAHRAGMPMHRDPDTLFRRETDRAIHHRLKKRSLDVGADRIARTAHAALALLGAIRAKAGRSIPLAWTHEGLAEPHAIEVYPAATRIAHGVSRDGRVDEIVPMVSLSDLDDRSVHERDAVLCAIAGWDFLCGRAVGPLLVQESVARREGWIWAARGDV